MGKEFTLSDAYTDGLKALLERGLPVPSVTDPTSAASNFGKADRPAIELLGHRFEVPRPIPALLATPGRRFDPAYAVGQTIWTLQGSDSVEWLAYYNDRAPNYSSDGVQLCGAFGKRLRDYAGVDQVDTVIQRLNDDPSSRRGIGVIISHSDNALPARDFPCAIASHYFVRNGRLATVVYMRAQQALTILPYDALVFMTIQSYVAKSLSLDMGPYIHFCGTFHIYEAEREQAEKVIESPVDMIPLGHLEIGHGAFDKLIEIETLLRNSVSERSTSGIEFAQQHRFAVGSFNESARVILLAFALKNLGLPVEKAWSATAISQELRGHLSKLWGTDELAYPK